MTILTATQARSNLYRLIDEVGETHTPIHITGKKSGAVLISEEDWSAIQETLNLVSIPGLEESIKKGMEEPLDNCKKDINW